MVHTRGAPKTTVSSLFYEPYGLIICWSFGGLSVTRVELYVTHRRTLASPTHLTSTHRHYHPPSPHPPFIHSTVHTHTTTTFSSSPPISPPQNTTDGSGDPPTTAARTSGEPMSSAGGQKPKRRFPPPCWTRDEALVLIGAYRERWYELHRAFLRTADWDAVAEKVTAACPDVTPPKTAAQCRHKMEKLRQRHRVEKQRATAFSGERFFSTWLYYEAMEAVENGSSTQPDLNPGPGIWVKPFTVQNSAALAPDSTKKRTKTSPNFNSKVSNRYNSNQDDDYEERLLVGTQIEEPSIPSAHRGRDSNNQKNSQRTSIGGVMKIKPSINPPEGSGRSGLRPRKCSKVVHDDDDDEMWIKIPKSTRLQRGKRRNEHNSVQNGKNLNRGKKNNGGIADMVSSIKLLGEGFMKVEKMKIDMAMEIEQMRMETEMKRNRVMLESQRQIVGAFVEGLIECRKMTTMADL